VEKKGRVETEDEVMESDKSIRGLNLKACDHVYGLAETGQQEDPAHTHVRFHKINGEPECVEDESAQKGNEENQ